MLWPLLGLAHVCHWATLFQRSALYLSNPVSPASLPMSSEASSALGVQHFSSQKCSDRSQTFQVRTDRALFSSLFQTLPWRKCSTIQTSKKSRDSGPVQSIQNSWINCYWEKHVSKGNLKEKKAGIQSTTAKAFFQSSGLSHGLLSERKGCETGTNTFFCTCCCKENM